MILLDLDPNVVKPGWTPLLITVGLALVMVLLFRSMRRQFRRVDVNFPEPAAPHGTVRILPEPAPADQDEDRTLAEGSTGGGQAPNR
jgi:hypothetical protein